MTVWAVSAVRNEADIVGDTFAHLLDGGCDRLLVRDGQSTDGTTGILDKLRRDYPDRVTYRSQEDPGGVFTQEAAVNELVQEAYRLGATWILPVDADEYWHTVSGGNIRDALYALPETCGVIHVPVIEHLDRDLRYFDNGQMPVVAFRPSPTSWLAMGAHSVAHPAATAAVDGILEVRTIQYRGRQHFKSKIRARLASLDPALPAGQAAHIRRYANLDEPEMDRQWDLLAGRPVVADPVPCAR